MASIVKVIKYGKQKAKVRKVKIKCENCRTKFVGQYSDDEPYPEWECPKCKTNIDKNGIDTYDPD